MSAIERPLARATRRSRQALLDIGREIRQARIERGLSQAAVGRAVKLSAPRVSVIERGHVEAVSLITLARMCAVVGLELSARVYPGGQPLRDRAHLALLERLRSRLGPGLIWRTEVPLPGAGDQRSWDATILRREDTYGVEGETRLVDVQAMERRVALKKRDGRAARVILLLSDTRWNRGVVRAHQGLLAGSFPIPMDSALARLNAGLDPGGDAIVLL
jgi:transcriptional regulator with XRE-family HTH domain